MKEIHPKILRTDTGPKRIAKPEAMTPPATPTPKVSDAAAVAKSQAKRIAIRRRVLLVALGVSVFCYFGQQRRPIGPSAGSLDVRTVVAAVDAGKPARLMIGTYNIHMGKGTDGRTDLSRIAGVIGGLDFVGLNEVLGPGLTERKDQAATLAEELKMTSLYTPTEERWWHAKFGNGLLTKLDVRSWQVVPLERRYGKSYRNFVHVRAKAANGVPLNIVVTHIDRSDDRERHAQLNTVGEYFKSLEKPAIWLGDLNTDANEPVMVRLLEGSDITDAVGKAKGFSAPRHIDWILTRGLEVKNAGLSPVGPSDHAHIWAELEVPPRPAALPEPYWLSDGAEYYAPGTEPKRSKEPAATQAKAATDKKAEATDPKPVDPTKLRKAATLRGGQDLIEAFDDVVRLYSTQWYVAKFCNLEPVDGWSPPPRPDPFGLAKFDDTYIKFEHSGGEEPKPKPPEKNIQFTGYIGFGR
jgi:endonuclease/exonuclease/phosphatase family metal-dependent hydrolase